MMDQEGRHARQALAVTELDRSARFDHDVTGPFDLAPFPTRGGAFLTPSVQLKYWPVETNAQTVIWAALELRTEVDAMHGRILSIHTPVLVQVAGLPGERIEVDIAAPRVVAHAVYLVFGSGNDYYVASFTAPRWLEPAYRDTFAAIAAGIRREAGAAVIP